MQSLPPVKDLLVETNNPDYLDKSVNHFGAAIVRGDTPGSYEKVNDAYIVRCWASAIIIKSIIEDRECGKVVREFEGLYDDDAFEDIVNG